MTARRLTALAALLLLTSCAALGDHERDRDRERDRDPDRAQAEERARKYCADEAKALGLRVESVQRIEKVAKRRYELKLVVGPEKKQLKKGNSQLVLCRYDDENRDARLD